LAAAAQGSQHRRERHSVGLDALGVHVLTSIECFGKQEIHALVRKIIYIKPPPKKKLLWFVAILVNLQIIGVVPIGKIYKKLPWFVPKSWEFL
jgi:hypothetical protein